MAHFAEIVNNVVVRVLVVDSSLQHRGEDFLANELGLGGTWVQCSYNSNIRKQFCGLGYAYDPVADVFIAPRPFPSWALDANHDWQAPTPRPQGMAKWDEATLSWVTL